MQVRRETKLRPSSVDALVRCILIALLTAILTVAAGAEIFPTRSYTVADGLVRDAVRRIRQDSRGFMWFCADEGISRFDGYAMTNFTVADGLPGRVVNDFLETRDGSVYIATSGGLARLNPFGSRGSASEPLFTIIIPENPEALAVRTLFQDSRDRIWAGTSDGLYELVVQNGELSLRVVPLGAPLSSSGGAIAQPKPNTLSISAILESRDGDLWIGSFGGGVFRLPTSGPATRLTSREGLPDNKITDLHEDRRGRIWASMRSDDEGGVCLIDAGRFSVGKCYSTNDGSGSNWIRDIAETGDGQIWLATVPGVCQWNDDGGDVCRTFAGANGLCADALSISDDRDGNMWIGSGCGVKRISRSGFTSYSTTDGAGRDDVGTVFENVAGDLFAASFPRNARTISRFDGHEFTTLKVNLPSSVTYFGWGWQQTVRQDSRGAWWIPTGAGLFRSADATSFDRLPSARLEKLETGAASPEVFRLFEDSRGDVWISTHDSAGELLRWERMTNRWQKFGAEAGFAASRVGTAFAEDGRGNIWIGASSDHDETALIRYRDGGFRVFGRADGAPSGWIQDIFTDAAGRVWLATDNDGLWRLDEPDAERLSFVKYTTADGLTSNSIASITDDASGRIYAGTWRGIDRLTPDTGAVDSFSSADGLPGSIVAAAFRDRRNDLWFATDGGVARFAPSLEREHAAPTTLITAVNAGGVARRISVLGEKSIPAIELASDQRQLSVEFVGLGASPGEKLDYEFRIDGGDWKPTGERSLNFANLGAGDYRFEVRARNAARRFGDPATVAFHVAAPLWQRPWFIILAVVAVIAVVYFIYRARLRRLIELQNVRMRIATDLHDDIGANLTKITLLSEVAKQSLETSDDGPLSSIAGIARESVASMNDIVWAIAPDHDSLLDLARRMRRHAEDVFAAGDVDLEFEAPGDGTEILLGLDARRDLLLIFKEAVSNAARHSECRRVSVSFTADRSTVTLRVADDGKGFDLASATDNGGHGVRSMNRRAAGLGGKLRVESSPGNGTLIELKLDVAAARGR